MLMEEGYPTPVEVWCDPGDPLGDHAHPFEVYALILAGSIELIVEGEKSTYRSGDIFYLGAEQVHSEVYGKEGVRYLASRREVSNF